jgi:hypothetical protein
MGDKPRAERMYAEIREAPMGARTRKQLEEMVARGDCDAIMRYLIHCVQNKREVGESVAHSGRVSCESRYAAVKAIFEGGWSAEASRDVRETQRPAIQARATNALGGALRALQGTLRCDERGYARDLRDNLVDGVTEDLFKDDFAGAGGHELAGPSPKMHAAYSSSALAVNVFARFKPEPGRLQVAGMGGFREVRFEAPCSSGLPGTPPTLDLLATGDDRVLAVECKCTEYLGPHNVSFSGAYDTISDRRCRSRWYALINDLRSNPNLFVHLDVAQLVKHALGLLHAFPDKGGREVTLAYVFWEPTNWPDTAECVAHRREIRELEEHVAGDRIPFRGIGYLDLWSSWLALGEPAWLPGHVEALKRRYAVAV